MIYQLNRLIKPFAMVQRLTKLVEQTNFLQYFFLCFVYFTYSLQLSINFLTYSTHSNKLTPMCPSFHPSSLCALYQKSTYIFGLMYILHIIGTFNVKIIWSMPLCHPTYKDGGIAIIYKPFTLVQSHHQHIIVHRKCPRQLHFGSFL